MRPEEKVFEAYPPKTKIDIYGECHDGDEELRKAYIKGCHDTVAEIMGDTIKRTELPTSLEEAAKEYEWSNVDTNQLNPPTLDMTVQVGDLRNAFKAGAEWQKSQMLKDAVEAYIVKSYNPCTEKSERSLHGIELLYEDKNKPYLLAGDKVRIVVLKAEEE